MKEAEINCALGFGKYSLQFSNELTEVFTILQDGLKYQIPKHFGVHRFRIFLTILFQEFFRHFKLHRIRVIENITIKIPVECG